MRTMIATMFSVGCEEPEVADSVIRLDFVAVMNDSARRDRAAKVVPLHPVLVGVSPDVGFWMSRCVDLHVAVASEEAKASASLHVGIAVPSPTSPVHLAPAARAARLVASFDGAEFWTTLRLPQWIAVPQPAGEVQAAPASSRRLRAIGDRATQIAARLPAWEHDVGITVPQPTVVMHVAEARSNIAARLLAASDRAGSLGHQIQNTEVTR